MKILVFVAGLLAPLAGAVFAETVKRVDDNWKCCLVSSD